MRCDVMQYGLARAAQSECTPSVATVQRCLLQTEHGADEDPRRSGRPRASAEDRRSRHLLHARRGAAFTTRPPVPAQTWRSPGADVAQSRRRRGAVLGGCGCRAERWRTQAYAVTRNFEKALALYNDALKHVVRRAPATACTGTGLTPATLRRGLGSPHTLQRARLQQADHCHVTVISRTARS